MKTGTTTEGEKNPFAPFKDKADVPIALSSIWVTPSAPADAPSEKAETYSARHLSFASIHRLRPPTVPFRGRSAPLVIG